MPSKRYLSFFCAPNHTRVSFSTFFFFLSLENPDLTVTQRPEVLGIWMQMCTLFITETNLTLPLRLKLVKFCKIRPQQLITMTTPPAPLYWQNLLLKDQYFWFKLFTTSVTNFFQTACVGMIMFHCPWWILKVVRHVNQLNGNRGIEVMEEWLLFLVSLDNPWSRIKQLTINSKSKSFRFFLTKFVSQCFTWEILNETLRLYTQPESLTKFIWYTGSSS